MVYAIVQAGGRQEKVSIGDELIVDKLNNVEVGAEVTMRPVMVVNGDKITSDAKDLAKVKVTAEVLGEEKGPKISIVKYKNKTGYRKRIGHRQKHTLVKITGIK